jgi:titin
VDWEYTFSPSVGTTLTFEVQWFDLPTLGIAGTVAYPTKTLTTDGLMTGEHMYRVRAVQTTTIGGGYITYTTESDWSPFVSAWVLTPPTGATVERVSNGMGIKVKWTGLDPAATHYQVLRTAVLLMRASAVHEGPHTDSSWVDNDVDPNKKYYYYVRAVKAGTESTDKDLSSQSSAGSITTPPEAPTHQVVYSTGRTITISWAHSGNCSQFQILARPVLLVGPVQPILLPNTQRSYAITDAQYGEWTIDLAASGDGGYSPGTPQLDVWVLTTPSAPMATVGGSTTVNLTWGSLDANATKVHVLRSASAGPFADIKATTSSATSWTDTTCLPGTTYAYKLKAVRDADASELSPASSSVTTPAALAAPAAPTGLTAVAQSSTAVGLTWADNANNEEIYRVYRRDGTAIPFGQVSPDLPAGTTSWQDVTVVPSSLYTYVLKAVNAAGDSDRSNEATVTTPAVPVPVPATPTNLVASAASPTVVNLTWADNAGNEDSYRAYRKEGTATAFVQVSPDLPAGTTSWQDTSAAPSLLYTYAVKARNPSGDSGWSNEASVTTPPAVQSIVMKLTIDKKSYTINGVSMMMDVAPVILESRTLGPVRYVAEALGAEVAWDPAERKVTLTRGSKVIELWIGRNTARVDGAYVLIDPQNPEVKPVILPPGRTMLPFRFIAEQLGAGVGWDPVKREVTITYPAS